MKIYQITDHSDLEVLSKCVLVLGYFDGLHRGHNELFRKARQIAKHEGLEIVVLTFNESPRLAFDRFKPELLCHLLSPQKRYEKFAQNGVNRLYLIDFTSRFASLSADAFITNYIQKLQAKFIVVGFDYQFGHNQKKADYLSKQVTGQVLTVPEVQYQGEKISSTRIRQLILSGKVDKANNLLGYPFSTDGLVVHGDARGRTIGFPTANLAPLDRTYLPADGVYVSDAIVCGKRYRSMTSIGKNVTFGGTELRLETHLFDFDGEIYGERIEIIWREKIRDMIKFASVDELVTQLKKDKKIAINWVKNSQNA